MKIESLFIYLLIYLFVCFTKRKNTKSFRIETRGMKNESTLQKSIFQWYFLSSWKVNIRWEKYLVENFVYYANKSRFVYVLI